MKQRIITGSLLILLLFAALYFGGYVFNVLFVSCMGLSVYEIYKVLRVKGHMCVEWPVWLSMIVSIPLFMEVRASITLMLPVVFGAVLLITIMIIFRDQPNITDLMVSCLPLAAVLLPGMCVLGLNKVSDKFTQLYLMILAFGVPVIGDTFAYFYGSRYGRKKLCPAVSPKKTVEGAIAGLIGSILFSAILWLIFSQIASAEQTIKPIWHFLIIGFAGGIAGQAGDLFASMIKRYCDVKDYGSLFPGHGGMMDRLDSVYWAAVIVYIYLNCL